MLCEYRVHEVDFISYPRRDCKSISCVLTTRAMYCVHRAKNILIFFISFAAAIKQAYTNVSEREKGGGGGGESTKREESEF